MVRLLCNCCNGDNAQEKKSGTAARRTLQSKHRDRTGPGVSNAASLQTTMRTMEPCRQVGRTVPPLAQRRPSTSPWQSMGKALFLVPRDRGDEFDLWPDNDANDDTCRYCASAGRGHLRASYKYRRLREVANLLAETSPIGSGWFLANLRQAAGTIGPRCEAGDEFTASGTLVRAVKRDGDSGLTDAKRSHCYAGLK